MLIFKTWSSSKFHLLIVFYCEVSTGNWNILMQTETDVHFKTLIKPSLLTFSSYNAVYSLSLTRYNYSELT